MRPITVIVLALVTLPVLALDVFLPDHGVAPASPAGTTKVLPSLGDWIGQVTKLSVVARAGTVNLERKIPADPKAALGTGWSLPDKGGYPVQASVVEPLLQGLLALREVAPRTDRPKLYDRLDLMDSTAPGANSRTIKLAKADGAEVATLVVGKHYYDRMGGAGGGDGLYVRKPDVTQTWLARPVFDVPGDMLSWVDRRIVDIEANKIKTLTLGGPGTKPIVLTRANKDALIALDDVPKGGNVKAQGDLDDIAAAFRYLDMVDVRPAKQISAAPTASVEATTFDGLDLSVTLVPQDGGTWALFEAKGSGDATKDAADIDARVKGWAYKLPETKAKSLSKRLGDLVVMTPPPTTPAAPAPKKG